MTRPVFKVIERVVESAPLRRVKSLGIWRVT